jgi:hypothetical protein
MWIGGGKVCRCGESRQQVSLREPKRDVALAIYILKKEGRELSR